jgi:hypothetical protein
MYAVARPVTVLVAPGPEVDAAAHLAGGARIAVGHMRGALLVAREDELERRVIQLGENVQDLPAGQSEDGLHPGFYQPFDHHVCARSHFAASSLSERVNRFKNLQNEKPTVSRGGSCLPVGVSSAVYLLPTATDTRRARPRRVASRTASSTNTSVAMENKAAICGYVKRKEPVAASAKSARNPRNAIRAAFRAPQPAGRRQTLPARYLRRRLAGRRSMA